MTGANDSSEYIFSPGHLHSPDEDVRRWAIIEISVKRLDDYQDRLIELLRNESSEANRRHIVRALGNVASERARDALMDILKNGTGLIVGDAAGALGKLGVNEATPVLDRLINSPVEWIANQSRWALKLLNQPKS